MTTPVRIDFRAAIALSLLAAAACSGPPAGGPVGQTTDPLFANGGFEASGGSLSGWTTTVYYNAGITYPPASYADLNLQSCNGITPGGIPDCTNRTSAKVNAVTESQQMTGLTGLASPRWPKFGTASAVVNEQGLHQNVNTMKQQYTTTAADVDPSDGKIHARFALSPQLQNPGHAANQQPYFFVVLRNITKGTTLYQTFNYSNEPGVPWKTYAAATPVLYTDWQIFDIAPGNAALMIGDTIEVEVVAAGCSPNGHWGQVFVDGFGAQLPTLSIAKTAPQWVLANADLTYSFQVENATSFVARNAVATEVIPANTTFKSIVPPAGATCTTPAVGATGTISCPLGWMNPYSSQTFQVTVHTNTGLANGTVITNGNYSVQGDGINPLLGPKVETTIGNGPYADLLLTVTDGVPAVVWGGPVSYTITVTNNGPTAVTNATVTDTFPAQLTGVAWTCAGAGGGSCGTASSTGNITAAKGKITLPVGASATYTVTANVVAGSGNGTLTNTATVVTPGGVTESNPANNTDADVDSIGTLYALTVTKDLVETGRGQAISSPSGISCGNACASQSVNFLDGSQVTVTAIARAGDTFDHWSGGCTGNANVCTVTLGGAPVSVAAHFRGPQVTGSVAAGSGTIACAPTPVVQQTSSTCTLTPAAGWQLTALTDNGADVLASASGGTYTLSGPSLVNDHAVVATFMKSNATACGAGTECASGICVDGVCCNGACNGQCQACDVAGSVGTCTAASGAPHGARAACASDGSACGGACDGVNPAACAYPGASTQCRGASCAAGTGTLAASCAGTGSCPAVQTQACNPYVCGATACRTDCTADGDCVVGDYCSSGACTPRLANGSTCSAANQCQSGNCVDGVCCDTACNGQCQACDVGGSVGICTTASGAPHGTRAACASDGSACGGACNGVNPAACTYPGASTSCRTASCTGATATLAATCAGTGSCPVVQTQTCSPYVCGAAACRTSCTDDGDCVGGDICSSGACTPRLGNGSTCASANQCQSGNCVDGVCCNTACGGQCQACDLSGSVGACAIVTGAPHGARTACASDGSACGGACDGSNASACAYPGAPTQCRGASCTGGTATLAASCGGSGACPAVQTQACDAFACGATACRTDCTADGDCAAGNYCASGACIPKLAQGAACGAANECATGHCVDSVCCDTSCNGQCEACDAAGSAGTCAAVAGTPHGARPACAADGSVCSGACDGTRTAACTYPADSTQCRAPTCAAGVATLAALCDGAGRCPALQLQACDPYACGATACVGTCASDGDCAPGDFCAAGVCVPRLGNGVACGGASQCASGHCVDGVCCDAACNGQCEACDAPGSAGTCAAVAGTPHGARPACAADGSVCSGACDGARTASCAYPADTTQCRAPTCAAGVATLAALCDGSGSCPALQTQSCGAFACGPASCLGDCTVDGDCAAGSFCSAGVCVLQLGNGVACGGASQCASGHCVDGVCCGTACNGQCEACDAPGSSGTCVAVTGAPHGARPTCAGDGSACSGACGGADPATCVYPDGSVSCRTADCGAGVATLQASCDGAGSCPARQTQSCGAYACGATTCRGDCAADVDCAAGNFCSAGVCVPQLGPAAACAGANQCASGHCVDGVCCDAACGGQCQACDLPGHAGACTAVTGAPHGARTACAGDGSACSGACDGSSPVACAYPDGSVSCRAAACASGVATLPSTCDGAGVCPARQDASCGVYACSGDACGTGCAVDADCAAGNVCLDGACGPSTSSVGWLVAGSGGCSSAGQADLAPLALVLCLLPLLRRRREARAPVVARRAGATARSGAAALLALLLATPARAQTSSTSFEVQRFQPQCGVWDILGVESAHVAGHLENGAMVYLNYANQPLRLVSTTDPSVQQPLLENQTGLDVGVSIGLFGWLEASLVLPMTAAQTLRPAGAIDPALGTQVAASGLGDLRLVPKVRLLEGPALALALALPVTFPTGKASGYLGQDGVSGGATAIAEYGRAGGFRAAINVGVIFRSAQQLMNLDVGNALAYGMGAEVPFAHRFSVLGTLVGQVGLPAGQAVAAPLELLAGVRWYAPLGLALTLGGGPGLTDGYGTPTYRLFFSLGLGPSPPNATAAASAARPEPVVAAPPRPPSPPPPPPPEPVVVTHVPPPPPPARPVPAPPPAKAVLVDDRVLILEQVHFATDKDVILKSSFDLLNQVASVLLANPQVTKIRVEGYTDDQGSSRHNKDLSARRANKITEFLIHKGVAAIRLESAGYGSTKPIASNATKDGRARNRRVEFVIVAQAPPGRS